MDRPNDGKKKPIRIEHFAQKCFKKSQNLFKIIFRAFLLMSDKLKSEDIAIGLIRVASFPNPNTSCRFSALRYNFVCSLLFFMVTCDWSKSDWSKA